jgi:hypothetical protein
VRGGKPMGGKSRKTGGISKELIAKIKAGDKASDKPEKKNKKSILGK